jgi:hypothetical protein
VGMTQEFSLFGFDVIAIVPCLVHVDYTIGRATTFTFRIKIFATCENEQIICDREYFCTPVSGILMNNLYQLNGRVDTRKKHILRKVTDLHESMKRIICHYCSTF